MKRGAPVRRLPVPILIMIGESLYGSRWQTALGRALGMNDGRRVRQWVAGDRPIAHDVPEKLCKIIKDHITILGFALLAIEEMSKPDDEK